jgi:hypothetical protein
MYELCSDKLLVISDIGLPAMYHSVARDGENTDGFHLIKAVTSRNLKNWTWLGNRSTFITPPKVLLLHK